MNEGKKVKPKLGATKEDHALAVAKGTLGAVPVIGAALTELVTAFIPQQRQERVEEYIELLEARLSQLEEQVNVSSLSDPDALDIFEEGAFQSVRATSTVRREQIATLVAHGLSGSEKERIETKRILGILRVLDDDQIIILSSYLRTNRFDDDFWNTHEGVLRPVGAHIQSSRDELDQDTMNKLARYQLVNLDLLRENYPTIKKGEIPEFDQITGQRKSRGVDITPLGRLVLRRLGLAGRDEL